MIVTLRKFIEIAPDIIDTLCCTVYLEFEHPDWGTDTKILLHHFDDMKEFESYFDYEIVDFHQEFIYGELDEQYVTLREVK